MNLLKMVGVKKSVLPKPKSMMPKLSDMHGMKLNHLGLGGGRKRRKGKSVGKILRGV